MGAPSADAVLHDLATNEAQIAHFQAKGRFVLKMPELDAVYSLPQSRIAFRRPAELFVEGRKYTAPVLRLFCSKGAFLLELPTEKQYVYRKHSEVFSGLYSAITPLEAAREIFLPEGWDRLSERRVRIERFDSDSQIAELAILSKGLRKRPVRRLWVQGPPWVIVRSQLIDPRTGATLAETTKDDYRIQDGVRFPAAVESRFPKHDAMMRLELRDFSLSEAPKKENFDIPARLKDLIAQGYQEAEYRPGSKP